MGVVIVYDRPCRLAELATPARSRGWLEPCKPAAARAIQLVIFPLPSRPRLAARYNPRAVATREHLHGESQQPPSLEETPAAPIRSRPTQRGNLESSPACRSFPETRSHLPPSSAPNLRSDRDVEAVPLPN